MTYFYFKHLHIHGKGKCLHIKNIVITIGMSSAELSKQKLLENNITTTPITTEINGNTNDKMQSLNYRYNVLKNI